MKTLERAKPQLQENNLETQEKVNLTTIEKIKILRQKAVKALKIAGVGITGFYLGANALKPQIAESILSNTYEHSTSETVKHFSENSKSKERNDCSFKTFTTIEGEKVRYIEYDNKGFESQMNGEGKILIEFAGIDGRMPIDNDKGFEKTIRIIYDSKQMTPEGIKHQAENISQMINKTFSGKYKISSSSTSFGALIGSYIKGVDFENQSTYAPFVGESAVVQEVTKLPIPVSWIHKDKYDNVIRNPNKNLKVTIPETDGLTGGKKEILEAYPQTKIIEGSNHTKIDSKSINNIKIKTSEKYNLFKNQNDKLSKINNEYKENFKSLFFSRAKELASISDKTNNDLEVNFLLKFPNREFTSKSYSKFISENPNPEVSKVGSKYLDLHIKLIDKSHEDERVVKEEYRIKTIGRN
jgi:hypothetical protein